MRALILAAASVAALALIGPAAAQSLIVTAQGQAQRTFATPEDAVTGERLGVDALVVQGPEAGGHRFTWAVEEEPDPRPLPDPL